jgi:hypothetical protein
MPATRSYFIDKARTLKAPFFRYGGPTGLVTVIAAGTASAGHLYALRNPSTSTKTVHLSRLRLAFFPTVAFGAAQGVRFAALKLTGYSVAHTGGTAITPAKKLSSLATASIATARIATTAELTAGTQTIAAQPGFSVGAWGTAPTFDSVWTPHDGLPELLEPGEGLLIRNEILMGATGVGVLVVEPEGWER